MRAQRMFITQRCFFMIANLVVLLEVVCDKSFLQAASASGQAVCHSEKLLRFGSSGNCFRLARQWSRRRLNQARLFVVVIGFCRSWDRTTRTAMQPQIGFLWSYRLLCLVGLVKQKPLPRCDRRDQTMTTMRPHIAFLWSYRLLGFMQNM